MAKRKTGMIVGVKKIRRGGAITDAEDEDSRLYLDAEAFIAEGDDVRKRKIGLLISDAEASKAVLYLLANMLPATRNRTVRTINRGGFGPPVERARPSL